MSVETFENFNFRSKTLEELDHANRIIGEYLPLGFVLTLRQLFYQFVTRSLLQNAQSEYKRLGTIVKNGRRAGLIDWSAIEDRTRNVRTLSAWESPAEVISAVADQYRENIWDTQVHRPEVWIEKDALLGVIEGVCNELRVPYFACRGNNSESEQYKAGKRFEEQIAAGLVPIVLHLGDHDPAGLDMTRDNEDRLAIFARHPIEVRRLALNMDQIERYRPPPNPAKEADTRFASYAQRFGNDCWELDALDPTVIADLIRTAIDGLIDANAWASAKARESANRCRLGTASANWALVEKYIAGAVL
jgi:hypothetical protein